MAGPKTTVMTKYEELLSTSVSMKVVYITSFQGCLLEYDGGGALIEKSMCYPGRLLDTGR